MPVPVLLLGNSRSTQPSSCDETSPISDPRRCIHARPTTVPPLCHILPPPTRAPSDRCSAPPAPLQGPPTGDLHWGEGYLATGEDEENSPAASMRRAPPARSTSLKHHGGNPHKSSSGVPDLSSDDLYATCGNFDMIIY